MIAAFVQGIATGAGLIVAIGAQNAFVLAQGIRRNHPLGVALICIGCDVVLISAGVAGVGSWISADPRLTRWMTWAGGGVLFCYGVRALRSAIRGGTLDPSAQRPLGRHEAITATLAVSLLNPHVYLDTVVLLGGISGRLPDEQRIFFWAGAVSASILWFFSLSLGGQLLAPVFTRPISWRVLDSLVGITMWSVAASLVMGCG